MSKLLNFYLIYYIKNKIYLINNIIFLFGSLTLMQWVVSDSEQLTMLVPGLLWLFSWLYLFLHIPQLIAADARDGTLDQLRLLPAPLEAVLLARLVVAWLGSVVAIGLSAALGFAYAGIDFTIYAPWLAGLAVALLAALSIGLFVSALLADMAEQAALAGILTIPFYAVLLIFGGRYVQALMQGSAWQEPLQLLCLMSLVLTPLSIVLSAMVLRED